MPYSCGYGEKEDEWRRRRIVRGRVTILEKEEWWKLRVEIKVDWLIIDGEASTIDRTSRFI